MSQANEDWEITKYLLTRSLFEDMPRSSFSEEYSSLEDSSGATTPRYMMEYEDDTYDKLNEFGSVTSQEFSHFPSNELRENSSPDSPLPPSLIIENEIDKHDEPQEFYIELETRIKYYYRMIFFGEEGKDRDAEVNEPVDGEDDSIEANSTPEFVYGSPLQITYYNESIPASDITCCNEDNIAFDLLNKCNENDDLNENSCNVINITRAEIHREPSNRESNQSLVSEAVNSPILAPVSVASVGGRERGGHNGDATLEEIINPGNDPMNKSIENADIEMMRGQEIRSRHLIYHNDSNAKDVRFSDTVNIMTSDEDLHLNVGNMDVINDTEVQSSFYENIRSFSTPKGIGRKRARYSHASGNNKRIKYTNMATQTAIEDTIEPNSAWKQIFVGIPRIYTLCSCQDHVCAR